MAWIVRSNPGYARFLVSNIGDLRHSLVPSNKLVGDIIEVVADNVRLRTYSQHIVADAFDQRALPARRNRAESIPGVAGDETELRGPNSKLFLDISVSLRRRLVVFHAVGAEAPFKQIDNAAVLELAGLHFKQIVGETEEPETRIAQLAQRRRNLGVGRHGRELFRKLLLVIVSDLNAARISQHFHDRRTDIGEWDVTAGHGQRRGVQDQIGEPQAHGGLVAKDTLEGRFHRAEIEKRFVYVEDDQRKSGHCGLQVLPRPCFANASAVGGGCRLL